MKKPSSRAGVRPELVLRAMRSVPCEAFLPRELREFAYEEGRRQIGAFYLPGDMFGLETGDEHAFSAEAITDCKIVVIKRSAVVALAARDNDVARQMWKLTAASCNARRIVASS